MNVSICPRIHFRARTFGSQGRAVNFLRACHGPSNQPTINSINQLFRGRQSSTLYRSTSVCTKSSLMILMLFQSRIKAINTYRKTLTMKDYFTFRLRGKSLLLSLFRQKIKQQLDVFNLHVVLPSGHSIAMNNPFHAVPFVSTRIVIGILFDAVPFASTRSPPIQSSSVRADSVLSHRSDDQVVPLFENHEATPPFLSTVVPT